MVLAIEAFTQTLASEVDPDWNIKVRDFESTRITGSELTVPPDHAFSPRILPHPDESECHHATSASCIYIPRWRTHEGARVSRCSAYPRAIVAVGRY